MDKLLVIDGNSILNRAFYAISGSNLLKTKEGIFTNAIYGFITIMQKEINAEKPTHIAVAFDLKAPTFRHLEYSEYKAGRHKMPEELLVQFPIIKEVLRSMNIAIFELEGYEADDIIGTIAKDFSNKNISVAILTGDRDSFQLVDDNIYIKLPHTQGGKTNTEKITKESIKEKYGLEPIQMIELKAIMGDSSDNIPGIPGVGEKTALPLIQKYNNVDGIYEFLENNPEQKEIKGKILEKITVNKDKAYLSRRLGEICLSVPLEYTDEDLKKEEYKYKELYDLLKKLELKAFIQKFDLEKHLDIKQSENNKVDILNIECINIENANDFEKNINSLINLISENKSFSYYYVYKEGLEFNNIKIFSFYIKDRVYNILGEVLTKEIFIKYFKNIFEDSNIKKICFDGKKDIVMFSKIGIEYIDIYFDILIAEYLLEPTKNKYILDDILSYYLDICLNNEETNDKQISFDLMLESNAEKKNNQNDFENSKKICLGIYKISEILKEKLKGNNQLELFKDMEMKLVPVLAGMEITGVEVDIKMLDEIGREVEEKVRVLEKEIYVLADCSFNINSPKQLGEILFEKLKLPVIKKNKTGYSTDVDVLEKIKDEHEIVERILEYRQYIKLKTTYIDGLKPYIINNRIHSKLNQTVTATGRLSSTEPNLQNIPVRTEYGKNLRKIFIPKQGFTLIDADYSQIELRVLAHMANDEVMINAFKNNEDIHTITAMQVFGLTKEEITSQDRSRAKAVNFGIVYGISDFGLATQVGMTVKEAKMYIEKYLEKYSAIKEFMKQEVEIAKEKGYVETLYNRRRYIPEIKSTNYNIRQFGERVAINAPIQGSAADIMKIAMINVFNNLKERKLKSKLILQIHDELIIESPNNEVEQVKDILINCMENATKLNVPLKVEAKIGLSWYETK